MRYLLDTNTAVDIMRHPRGDAAERFLATTPADMAMSIVAKAELLVGPNRKKSLPVEITKVQRFLIRLIILPFDDACAEEFGRIAACLLDAGTPVGGIDVQIAATARLHRLIVVTANVREFVRIPDLRTENWIAPEPPPGGAPT